MHELGIATNIVEAVQREIASHGYGRVTTVALRVGAMTDVDHEALRFGFDVITRDTPLNGVRLAIESVPIRIRCERCGQDSEIQQYHFICPKCAETRVTLINGTELDIAYLEIEERTEEAAANETGQQV